MRRAKVNPAKAAIDKFFPGQFLGDRHRLRARYSEDRHPRSAGAGGPRVDRVGHEVYFFLPPVAAEVAADAAAPISP